ncbi:ETS-related transcription factor Elf-5-like isoform X1 [Neodiprion virginianus]|uniref:ETS-related transcription factor Elf-5-like isoform X1 n=1 Tax=Neodiprion virginianus TaxID=2961670 RepID=UPI001EE70429|nr:ETS-related transcription factor Elf-5-like isoform X1 [Neodiprion virginianus]
MKLEHDMESDSFYTDQTNGGVLRFCNYDDVCSIDHFHSNNKISPVDCSRDPYYDSGKPLQLLNLDAQSKVKSEIHNWNIEMEDPYNKSRYSSDEDMKPDCNSWMRKPIEYWDTLETKSWLLSSFMKLGIHYEKLCTVAEEFSMPGNKLVQLSLQDFVNRDHDNGGRLYEILQEHRDMKYHSYSFAKFPPECSDDETSVTISQNYSDEESVISTDYIKKRQPGRPRSLSTKQKPAVKNERLWEYVRNLLLNPKFCPQWICWENYEKKRFRFVKSDCVAKMWGSRKHNPDMTYEKFSRAMRYYYKKGIFVAVQGRRLVYQFGPAATGLETDDPNFRKSQF